jgi:hypothetical protein
MSNGGAGACDNGAMPVAWLASIVTGILAFGLAGVGSGGVPVAKRSPRAGAASGCPHPTIPVPPNEPVYTTGATELVSGLYIQGGALPPPPCKMKPRGPYAGKITVTDAGTGATVVTKSVRNGHLAHIPLPPGSYKVAGRIKGGGNTSFSPTVTIKQGYKTRQDLFEDVP